MLSRSFLLPFPFAAYIYAVNIGDVTFPEYVRIALNAIGLSGAISV